ncbi:Hypothetical predicted protein, partial [Paramuricea clavata]
MAQADTGIVTRLRKAILNIIAYPRGCRRYSHLMAKLQFDDFDLGNELYKSFCDLIDQHLFYSANRYFDSEAPFQLEDILISGSISEGMLKIVLKKESMSDMDLMLILKNIKVSEEEQRKGNLMTKENTPFVTLYLTDEDDIKMWADFIEASSMATCERSTKLSSRKLKERFRENYIRYGPFCMPLGKEEVEKVDEGPSLAVSSELPGNWEEWSIPKRMPFPVGEYDFVLAIKCNGWPLSAQEWLSRPRCWPNQDIIQKIIKDGFHVVLKSSSEGNFRLSYSNAEVVLIQNLSNLQHKTYRAFKSFISHYKNELAPNGKKLICSYHLKTIVLWYCEKSDPSDWTEESIVGHLLSLIDDLIIALKESNLPMYFMPKYNLMEQIEDGKEIAEKISDMRFNLSLITEAIISEEPDILEWANFLFNQPCVSGCFKAFERGVEKGNFDQNDLFQCLQTVETYLDEFWMNFAGKIPQARNDLHAKKAYNIL